MENRWSLKNRLGGALISNTQSQAQSQSQQQEQRGEGGFSAASQQIPAHNNNTHNSLGARLTHDPFISLSSPSSTQQQQPTTSSYLQSQIHQQRLQQQQTPAQPNPPSSAATLRDFFAEHRQEEWFRRRYHPENLREADNMIVNYVKARRHELVTRLKTEFRDYLKLKEPNEEEKEKETETEKDKDQEEEGANPDAQPHEEKERADCSWMDELCQFVPTEVIELRFIKLFDPLVAFADDTSNQQRNNYFSKDDDPDDGQFQTPRSQQESEIFPVFRSKNKSLYIMGISRTKNSKELAALFSKDGALKIARVSYTEPNARMDYQRNATITYETKEMAAAALEYLDGLLKKSTSDASFPGFFNVKWDEPPHSRGTCPPVASEPVRILHDYRQALALARHLDKVRRLDMEKNPFLRNQNALLNKLRSASQRLDVLIHYLYEVHAYAYYVAMDFVDHPEIPPPIEKRLLPKNPIDVADSFDHNAGKLKDEASEAFEWMRAYGQDLKLNPLDLASDASSKLRLTGWMHRVDDRANRILQRHRAERSRHEKISDARVEREEASQEWLNSNTRMEREGRYRCALPPYKLFKDASFVHKHLKLKQADKLKEIVENVDERVFRQNFLQDPKALALDGGPRTGPLSGGPRGTGSGPPNVANVPNTSVMNMSSMGMSVPISGGYMQAQAAHMYNAGNPMMAMGMNMGGVNMGMGMSMPPVRGGRGYGGGGSRGGSYHGNMSKGGRGGGPGFAGGRPGNYGGLGSYSQSPPDSEGNRPWNQRKRPYQDLDAVTEKQVGGQGNDPDLVSYDDV